MNHRLLAVLLGCLSGCTCTTVVITQDAGPRDAGTRVDAGFIEADAGQTDAGELVDAGVVDAGACPTALCNGVCCAAIEACRYQQCLPDLGRCLLDGGLVDGGACPSDTYCDTQGFCTPYGVPPGIVTDPRCTQRSVPAPLVPATQCLWTDAGINGTPVVANLGRPKPDGGTGPIVVVAVNSMPGSPYTTGGALTLFDGKDCSLIQTLNEPTQIVASAGTAAIGDLDLDGKPELVAESGGGGVIAFKYDTAQAKWVTAWVSDMRPGPFTGPGISLADLFGDARPEISLGGYVFDATGHLLDGTLGELPYQGYSNSAVLADVDLDGVNELIGNNGVYQFNDAGVLVREAIDQATTRAGFMAVADFGEFPGKRGDAPGRPELVLYSTPNLIVRTIGGDTVFSASGASLVGGGAPAVADLDGDGKPEIVVAGRAMMAFDPDCAPDGGTRGGACASNREDGVLWLQNGLQDGSSAINGVTVFDFDGDGKVEVVEADECFVRIFDGTTGAPKWSAPRTSCTFVEMPIVADTDDDLSAEIIVPANQVCSGQCGLSVGAPDPILPGFACTNDAACPQGSNCIGRLCRCTSPSQCGAGNTCTPPPNGDGLGNVCRSTYASSPGLKIYGDARNRWVPSRTVWNEYAYSITNVGDDGVVPSAASMRNNWRVGLNNFRQNVQGGLGDLTAPNLTIGPSPLGCSTTMGGPLQLRAHFCNRGTGVAQANSSVEFQAVSATGARSALCTASAGVSIPSGTCIDVSCTTSTTLMPNTRIEGVADANQQVQECHEDDNVRIIYSPSDCTIQ